MSSLVRLDQLVRLDRLDRATHSVAPSGTLEIIAGVCSLHVRVQRFASAHPSPHPRVLHNRVVAASCDRRAFLAPWCLDGDGGDGGAGGGSVEHSTVRARVRLFLVDDMCDTPPRSAMAEAESPTMGTADKTSTTGAAAWLSSSAASSSPEEYSTSESWTNGT